MNKPSVKTLMKIEGMEIDRARLLRRVLVGRRSDLENLMEKYPDRFKGTIEWYRKCYSRPWISELKMSMANDLIEGFGIEHCGEVDMRDGPPLEYINLGDTYACTLCLFQGRYLVSSCGDIVEKHERLFRDQ